MRPRPSSSAVGNRSSACRWWRVEAVDPAHVGLKGGGARRPPSTRMVSWLGVLPFFLFSAAFLIGPAVILVYRSLEDPDGGFTFQFWRQLTSDQVMRSYGMSVRISLATAVV